MSEEEFDEAAAPTSPTLPTNDTYVNSARSFSGAMTLDLTDAQIQHAWRIIQRVRSKWMDTFRRKFNDPSFNLDTAMEHVEQFEDEVKYELADKCNVLATVNTIPLLEGRPLEIEWIGVLPGHEVNRYGMDHERKEWEVKRANQRDENFLGEHDG